LNQKDPNYKKLNVLVLTHSKAILNQWRREVIEKLGLSGNPTDSYTKPIDYNGLRISFNTLQTVYRIPTAYRADFLIVDEVHHSAAYEYRKALEVSCKYKMGLSATIEGKQKISYLKNYLGDKIYTLSIKEARERNIIPEFKWDIFVTNLNVVETQEFDKVTDDINKIFDKISKESDFYTERIFGKRMRILTLKDFIELIERARYEGKDKILPDSWKYLSIIIQQRRRIIHKSAPKIKKAIEIAEKEAVNKKCILFTMDIETCDKIAKELKVKGIKTYVVHSNFNDNDNKNTLSNFKLARNGILISAKMLDEGVDISDATIGINVSSSSNKSIM
jgi:superfamily II DNA or RNA helicase